MTNKWHGRIKEDSQSAEANKKPIDWLAGLLKVISLPDEETKDKGLSSGKHCVRQCDSEKVPPLVIADYIEEFADRLAGRGMMTEQIANKEVMRVLKGYACRRQARVLAVYSVSRGTYNGQESVFNNQDAEPEEFKAVIKHSGYLDYALSSWRCSFPKR